MLNRMKIKTKLVVSFLIVGIVPILTIGLLAYFNAANSLTHSIEERLETITNQKKIQLNSQLQTIRSNLQAIARTSDIEAGFASLITYHSEVGTGENSEYLTATSNKYVSREYDSIYEQINNQLAPYPEEYGYEDMYLICIPHGHIMYTNGRKTDLGCNLSLADSAANGLVSVWSHITRGTDFILTDTAPYEFNDENPALFAGTAVKNDAGELIGVLAARIGQHSIDEITQESAGLGISGESYLVGEDRLFRSNSRLISETTVLEYQSNSMAVEQCFATHADYASTHSHDENRVDLKKMSSIHKISDVVSRATYLPEFNWVLVTEMGVSEAFKTVDTLKKDIFLFVLLTACGVVLFAITISKNIIDPIGKVVNRIRDIAHGDGDLTARLNIESQDEIGELAKWFDTFIEKLQLVIASVKNGAKEVAATGHLISAAAEQMASGAEQQQGQLSEVAASMEEMSSMILETSHNAESTLESSGHASSASQDGRSTVELAIQGMEGISNIVHSASLQIASLKENSEEIGEVIQVIDDIADQTNLLALNANIEAARAGEAGRGFAVVADEVRKLAERTVKATSDISQKINQVQSAVNGAVKSMDVIIENSEQGQERATEAGKALDQIGESISRVNIGIGQIATAAIEQSSGVEQISRNVENVSTVSKQSASGAHELAAAAEELNAEVQELDELMGQFKV